MVEPHTFGNFDFTLNGKFLLHGDHTLPSNLSIAGEMRLPMWTSVYRGDLHDFGGGGNVFGVGREEFEGTAENLAEDPWVPVGSDILHTFRIEGTGEEGGDCCPSPATLFIFARRPEQG